MSRPLTARRFGNVMNDAWRQIEAHGQTVTAVKIAPDGSVMLLTNPQDESPPSSQDWVDLAGQATVSRA